MALARSRRDSGMNYWPGFVDALSTLVLSVIFLLTVFMVAQFFLSEEMAGKDTALQRLNAQISRLSQLLSLEQTGKANLEDEVAQMRASLSAAVGERDRLRGAAGANPAPGAGRRRCGSPPVQSAAVPWNSSSPRNSEKSRTNRVNKSQFHIDQ